MEGHWIGPMPVQDFLDDFLGVPGGEGKLLSPTHLHDLFQSIKLPATYKNERAYAEAIIALIQSVSSVLIPAFQVVLGKEYKDPNAITKTVTDAFMYKSSVNTGSRPTQWDKAELWAEFKRALSDYGFKDNGGDGWVWETKSSKKVRGQITGYACETLNAQYRKHLFSLSLGPDGVRFFKWERTYTVVSRAFDLATEGRYLVEFLYRFCTLTDGHRGKDETVMPATKKEIAMAKKSLKPWIHPSTDKPRPFVKIRVADGGEGREVIAGPHIATPRRIVGRATLGLPVYDLRTKTIMFLKDSWRDANLPQECTILEALNKAKVRNVPTLVCGGVVSGQQTTSHTYIEKHWNHGAHPAMICVRWHQRTLTKEVGHPLKTFKSPKQLMRVVYDAFIGHEDAYGIGYLHRDISGGNILIVYDEMTPADGCDGGGRGLLNDWDMAIKMADLAQARQADRTGTWQFMSIRLLEDRTKRHEPQDDFESFVYVMLFYGLSYLPHNEDPSQLRTLISGIFDAGMEASQERLGVTGKSSLVHCLRPLRPQFKFDCIPFDNWIMSALAMIRTWLSHLNPLRGDVMSADAKPVTDIPNFQTHDGLRLLWDKILAMDGWPAIKPAHVDQPKPQGTKRRSTEEPQPLSKRQKSRHSSSVASPAVADT